MNIGLWRVGMVASAILFGIAAAMPALANVHPTLPLPDAATLGLLAGAVVAGAMLGHLRRADD